MSQRIRRAKDRKHQNIDQSVMATGGNLGSYSRQGPPIVRTPQKVTGNMPQPTEPAPGIAKASPFFKKLEEILPTSKVAEKKVVAESTEKTLEEDEEDK